MKRDYRKEMECFERVWARVKGSEKARKQDKRETGRDEKRDAHSPEFKAGF